jgi:hypothetical protein
MWESAGTDMAERDVVNSGQPIRGFPHPLSNLSKEGTLDALRLLTQFKANCFKFIGRYLENHLRYCVANFHGLLLLKRRTEHLK